MKGKRRRRAGQPRQPEKTEEKRKKREGERRFGPPLPYQPKFVEPTPSQPVTSEPLPEPACKPQAEPPTSVSRSLLGRQFASGPVAL